MDGTVLPFLRSRADIAREFEERRAREAADAECACAFAAAERLCVLLERHIGDAGTDVEALESVTNQISALGDMVLALLGRPASALVGRDGRIVGLVRDPR